MKFGIPSLKLLSFITTSMMFGCGVGMIYLTLNFHTNWAYTVGPIQLGHLARSTLIGAGFGMFLVVIELFAFLAIWLSSYGMLVVYIAVLSVSTIISSAYGISFWIEFKAERLVKEVAKQMYTLSPELLDTIQGNYRCCGIEDYTDYFMIWMVWGENYTQQLTSVKPARFPPFPPFYQDHVQVVTKVPNIYDARRKRHLRFDVGSKTTKEVEDEGLVKSLLEKTASNQLGVDTQQIISIGKPVQVVSLPRNRLTTSNHRFRSTNKMKLDKRQPKRQENTTPKHGKREEKNDTIVTQTGKINVELKTPTTEAYDIETMCDVLTPSPVSLITAEYCETTTPDNCITKKKPRKYANTTQYKNPIDVEPDKCIATEMTPFLEEVIVPDFIWQHKEASPPPYLSHVPGYHAMLPEGDLSDEYWKIANAFIAAIWQPLQGPLHFVCQTMFNETCPEYEQYMPLIFRNWIATLLAFIEAWSEWGEHPERISLRWWWNSGWDLLLFSQLSPTGSPILPYTCCINPTEPCYGRKSDTWHESCKDILTWHWSYTHIQLGHMYFCYLVIFAVNIAATFYLASLLTCASI